MTTQIATVLVGIILIGIGISNMRGNVSTLHFYHRKRVSEENLVPFGKRVGLGNVIVGLGIVAYGALGYVAASTGNQLFTTVATVVLIAALVVGLGISFAAMKKYNDGIF